MTDQAAPGTLYLCATPIGNLEDITMRVLRVLGEVDVIAAEDTRRTRALLTHFRLRTPPLTSFHRFNEAEKAEELCRLLLAGKSVALVSDAGTPGISDPGSTLVALAIERGVPVTVLPGPSAVVAALTVSGLDTRRFSFEGFLPRRKGERRRRLEELADDPRTLVFYEAPHRIAETVAAMREAWGDRRCALVRELTKLHEEVLRTTLSGLEQELAARPRKGEMVLVVEGRRGPAAEGETADDEQLRREVIAEMEAGKSKKAAIGAVAERRRLPRRVVYHAVLDISGVPEDGDGADGDPS